MGVVYLARAPDGAACALKVLREEYSQLTELRRRFEREARIALSVRHPNLVPAIDAGEVEGRLYLASELVDGGTLKSLLQTVGRLAPALAVAVTRDVLSGLSALARHHLVHRDLKPHNVLLERSGRARVTDFGLARPTAGNPTRYTRTDQFIGSPYYVAPEQIVRAPGEEVDARCDLYALGVQLYECLCGAPPYGGHSRLAVLESHLHGEVPDVRALCPEAGDGLAELVSALLEKKPDARPPTPESVLARLDALAGSLPPAPESIAELLAERAPEKAAPAPLTELSVTSRLAASDGDTLPLGELDAAPQDPTQSSS